MNDARVRIGGVVLLGGLLLQTVQHDHLCRQERAIDVRVDLTDVWTCTLADYICKKPDLSAFRRRAFDGVAPTCNAQSQGTRKSPDGKLEARINDYEVVGEIS